MTQEFVPPKEVKSCPIDNTFKIMGKKFTVHIIRNMSLMGQTKFNQFLNSIEGINSNTLATRLKEMKHGNLIKKEIFNETPIRIEYTLTEKGTDLMPVLEQMAAFSLKHSPEIFIDGKTRSYQQVCGRDPASL